MTTSFPNPRSSLTSLNRKYIYLYVTFVHTVHSQDTNHIKTAFCTLLTETVFPLTAKTGLIKTRWKLRQAVGDDDDNNDDDDCGCGDEK
jgi:hypothetical protein